MSHSNEIKKPEANPKGGVDKAALEASKQAHETAKATNQTVKK